MKSVLLILFSHYWAANAFSFSLQLSPSSPSPRGIARQRRCLSSSIHLNGLLDDMMDGKEELDSAATVLQHQNREHEDLFHSLILSGDTRRFIEHQFDKCSEESFVGYLSSSMKESTDDEEVQGFQDLLELIQQVQTDAVAQQKAAEEQVQAAKSAANDASQVNSSDSQSKIMSNADVLKQANAIDQAVMIAAMTDDEKPSDFISDCREVVNLSGGFNNNGKMRVGGR